MEHCSYVCKNHARETRRIWKNVWCHAVKNVMEGLTWAFIGLFRLHMSVNVFWRMLQPFDSNGWFYKHCRFLSAWNCPSRESNFALLPIRLLPELMWTPETPPLRLHRRRHLFLLHGEIPPRFVPKIAFASKAVVIQVTLAVRSRVAMWLRQAHNCETAAAVPQATRPRLGSCLLLLRLGPHASRHVSWSP